MGPVRPSGPSRPHRIRLALHASPCGHASHCGTHALRREHQREGRGAGAGRRAGGVGISVAVRCRVRRAQHRLRRRCSPAMSIQSHPNTLPSITFVLAHNSGAPAAPSAHPERPCIDSRIPHESSRDGNMGASGMCRTRSPPTFPIPEHAARLHASIHASLRKRGTGTWEAREIVCPTDRISSPPPPTMHRFTLASEQTWQENMAGARGRSGRMPSGPPGPGPGRLVGLGGMVE